MAQRDPSDAHFGTPTQNQQIQQPETQRLISTQAFSRVQLKTDLNGSTEPSLVLCPSCSIPNVSIIRTHANIYTWLWAGLGSFVCLCWVPFLIRDCNNIEHYCSNKDCIRQVGISPYKPCQ